MERAISLFTVLTVEGEVYARGSDGSLRVLQAGDKLYKGEVILTRGAGEVRMESPDGTVHQVKGELCSQVTEDGGIEELDEIPDDLQSFLNNETPNDAEDLSPDATGSEIPETRDSSNTSADESHTHGFVRTSRVQEEIGLDPDLPGHTFRDVNETHEFTNRATLNPRVNDLFDDSENETDIPLEQPEDPFEGFEDTDTPEEPVNRPPLAEDDQGTVDEDGSLVVESGQGLLVNDSDPDGDPVEVAGINGDPGNLGGPVEGTQGGTFVVNPDGSYEFNPGDDFQDLDDGETRDTTITYTVTDDEGNTDEATLTITVTGSNDAPESTAIESRSDDDADVISLDVSGSFSDPDASDTLTYSAEGLPDGLTIDPDTGEITGTIDNSASQEGPDNDGVYSVTVTAEDNNGEITSQTFTWTVSNPVPEAENDTDETGENDTLTVAAADGVLSNDSDPDGDDLSIIEFTNGTDTETAGGTVAGSDGGTFTLNTDGSYTFDPGTDFQDLAVGETRETSITYTVDDGEGGTEEATLTITVTGANDGPTSVAIGDQSNSDADSNVEVDVSDSFSDIDNNTDFTYIAEGLPPGLQIDPDTGIISGTIDNSASQGGPDSNGIYSVTITAEDGFESTSQTFTWTVDNPSPEANSDTGTTDEETPITVDDQNGVLSNDSDTDADDIFVEQVNGDPGNVGISVDGGNGGSFTLNADGSYSFDPENDFQDLAEGETRDTTINYTTSDGEGGTSTTSLTVTVEGVNDGPDALDDTATTGEDSSINVDQGNGLLTNDSDPDTSDNLTVTEIGNGTDTEDVGNGGTGISGNNGGTFTIDPDGSYTFDPGSDFQDLDDGETRETSITYTIDDGNGGTDEATLTITVTGANDAPSPEGTIGDQTNLDADEIASVDVSGAFSDADGDTLSYSATELPQGLTIDPDTGVISGTIDNSASQEGSGGVYSVTVTASDGDESTDQTFTWTVNNPDPAAVDDTGKT